MDDYGRPLVPQDNAADDGKSKLFLESLKTHACLDGVRHNVGLISEWHELGSDYNVLMTLAKPGDLLEFKREGYEHWAVFIGDHVFQEVCYKLKQTIDKQISTFDHKNT